MNLDHIDKATLAASIIGIILTICLACLLLVGCSSQPTNSSGLALPPMRYSEFPTNNTPQQ